MTLNANKSFQQQRRLQMDLCFVKEKAFSEFYFANSIRRHFSSNFLSVSFIIIPGNLWMENLFSQLIQTTPLLEMLSQSIVGTNFPSKEFPGIIWMRQRKLKIKSCLNRSHSLGGCRTIPILKFSERCSKEVEGRFKPMFKRML